MSKVVALDIGHGADTFPPSKGIYKNGKEYPEHSFNAKLVPAIDKLLRANGIDTIIYQKPNKPDVPLIERTNYYNKKKVDLVYSIHANYNASPDVNGRCVFYWHSAKDAKKLANIIVDEIKKAGYSLHGNGLHAGKVGSWTNLHINRETQMTAVLIENGFMSGNKDFDLIFGSKQADYIKDMAEVHAKSICRYFGIKYKGVSSKPTPNKPASKPKSKQRGVATVTVASLNLRDKPSTSGNLIRKLSKGESYKVWNEKNGWLRLGKDMWASWQNGAYMDWTKNPTKKKSKPKPKPAKKKYPLPNGVLKSGSRGNKVKQLQRALNAANFKVGKEDGIYGAKTKDGVTRFQQVHDAYNVDGIYGPRTKKRLDKVVN